MRKNIFWIETISLLFYCQAEGAIDGALKQTSQAVDHKLQEANQYVDQKRQSVEKTVQEAAGQAQESAGQQANALLGKLHLGQK